MAKCKTPLFLGLTFLFLFASTGYSQVVGCKDPNATNYNPLATVADTTCEYPNTNYAPPVFLNSINDTLIENSGLQWAGNSLWTFNDGQHEPAIYRISTTQAGRILQIVTLDGATNVDWEDIAFDGTFFYIGDFGNNLDGARTDLKIYKFPISAINPDYTNNRNITIPSSEISIIHFSYNNRGTITPATPNNTRFDCEAMITEGGKIHLFSKNWIDLTTTHYQINSVTAGTYVADSIETLGVGYLVTGADITPNSKVIVLLGYQNTGFRNHFMHLLTDYSSGFYFNGNRRKIGLPDAFVMGQAEGICFINNTDGYISNEAITSPFSVPQKLRSFNTTSFLPFSILPAQLLSFQAVERNSQHQLSWTFSEGVDKLKIIRTSDSGSVDEFLVSSGTSGSYVLNQRSASNCYKLAWQSQGGRMNYSNTVCLNQDRRNAVTQMALTHQGKLSFHFTGAAERYQFRVMSTDGKLIAQSSKFLSTGSQMIDLSAAISQNIVILQLIGGKENKTFLLHVHH